MEFSSVILTTGSSVVFFRLVNAGVGRLPVPEPARRNVWKWRNISSSFVHSVITAIWAVLCFFFQPQMAEDLIETYSVFSHALVSFSIGEKHFFVLFLSVDCDSFPIQVISSLPCCDSLHVTRITVHRQREEGPAEPKLDCPQEQLINQVITCFGLSVVSCRYVGFAVVALLVEINSVFLHFRQMLRMANMAASTLHRINSMINLGTYVVFRINTLAWMTRWLVINRDNVPLVAYTLGSVGMAIMTAMNIILFCRLLRSDFLKSSMRDGKKEKET
ncbi:TLC domain-containing protein 2 [Austrofundulus limnaeus]|uniref:TLC domain-containing protein 2 n=1 Tax=Austrofundulus limnaeus TaxID=52670 RepID=A0A2I4AYS0_AUSLI|nr:PREDICTED: TLC domain-containing protein 2 [Austrofundulus limnaeus]